MTQTTPQIHFITRKTFKGDIAEVLHNAAIAQQYTSNEWATMKQWNYHGRSISRGEKGVPFTFTRTVEGDQGPVKEPFTTYLFNRCQLVKVKQQA